MKTKNLLVGASLLIVGYVTGNVIGQIRLVKQMFDEAEKDIPGIKQKIMKEKTCKIIDHIFESK